MDKEPKYRPSDRGRVNLNCSIKVARACLGRMRKKSLLDVTPRRGSSSRMKGMDEVSQRGLILIFCFLAPFGAGVTLVVLVMSTDTTKMEPLPPPKVSSPYQSSKLERSPWKLVRHQSAKEKRRDQIVPSFSTAASFLLQVEDARR